MRSINRKIFATGIISSIDNNTIVLDQCRARRQADVSKREELTDTFHQHIFPEDVKCSIPSEIKEGDYILFIGIVRLYTYKKKPIHQELSTANCKISEIERIQIIDLKTYNSFFNLEHAFVIPPLT
jgi:hypothetical protein